MTDEAERGGRNVNGHARKPIFPDEHGNLRPVKVGRIEEVGHAKHASRHRSAVLVKLTGQESYDTKTTHPLEERPTKLLDRITETAIG